MRERLIFGGSTVHFQCAYLQIKDKGQRTDESSEHARLTAGTVDTTAPFPILFTQSTVSML